MLLNLVNQSFKEGRRLIAPLIGFPGVNMTGSSIKLAQQNCSEHFKVLTAISNTFNPDVIFPLMDLSIEANALGRLTVFPKEESATVIKDDFTLFELKKLEHVDITFDSRVLSYVQTVGLMKKNFSHSTLRGAYITGPYTLASLLMGSEEAAIATMFNYSELHRICEFTTRKILDYVRLLISSGAQLICILEPSGVMLDPEHFEKFSVNYVKCISNYCRNKRVGSIYHICGNTIPIVEKMLNAGIDALSMDSIEAGVDFSELVKCVSPDIILIGNISPIGSLLKGTPDDVQKEVLQLLKTMEPYPNFILSTGCDLPLETPVENILAFMQTGHTYRFN